MPCKERPFGGCEIGEGEIPHSGRIRELPHDNDNSTILYLSHGASPLPSADAHSTIPPTRPRWPPHDTTTFRRKAVPNGPDNDES